MPELPEVETTRAGISAHVVEQKITEILIRRSDLRWPISPEFAEMQGARFLRVNRRSKYLILDTNQKTSLLIHLGMSGSLRVVPAGEEWKKHDHFGITFENKQQLRYHDPRRFGLALVCRSADLASHPLLKNLGPEPLGENFTADYLFTALRKKSIPIKVALMDAKIVVGVGNIYASESLFRAKISPQLPAYQLSKAQATRLVNATREVLRESIAQGGTTLRDFLNSDGKPGYFKQRLFVYDRKEQPCRLCASHICHEVLGQRATYWCPSCQKS